MGKHVISDLWQMQSLPLEAKIRMTKYRIRQWVEYYGEDGVYVSFSGGKDSTVLLDLVRQMYSNVTAVFVDTGLEYPEIREFVKTFSNVVWLKPKKNFKQVITEYGYPFISKEVSDKVDGARKYMQALNDAQSRERERERERESRTVRYAWGIADLLGIDRRGEAKESPEYLSLKMGIIPSETSRYQQVVGTYKNKDGSVSKYCMPRYKFFLEAPFNLSASCCRIMKKSPVHSYGRKTHKKPMTAQMASESRLRTAQWLRNGCNGFEMTSPISNPMSFWTEQDVLLYIELNKDRMCRDRINCHEKVMWYGSRIVSRETGATIESIEYYRPICSVYGDIVTEPSDCDYEFTERSEIFDKDRPLLKTTGCSRTGCMFCGYGCHLEKSPTRFEQMKETHPKQYAYIMKPVEEGGLGYKDVIDWINQHGNMDIKY
jgi:3'-phosphoadenosine 5'-phosphosulfate sulfotransferase (PAPS reductase)/FAD synthetase